MKIQEFKLRIVQGANNLIDDYFGTTSIVDKLINSTLKMTFNFTKILSSAVMKTASKK